MTLVLHHQRNAAVLERESTNRASFFEHEHCNLPASGKVKQQNLGAMFGRKLLYNMFRGLVVRLFTGEALDTQFAKILRSLSEVS